MNRAEWLAERRTAVERDYTRDASTYDDGYDPVTPVHVRFVARLTEMCRECETILDAACGTGPHMGMVLDAGRLVVGIDQSEGMVDRSMAKYPGVRVERVGLQELGFEREFEGVMFIDAMEHVPSEEWPTVLANLRRALRPGGHLYLTVEQANRDELERAFSEAAAAGFPVIRGEDVGDGTGGYHYYPGREHVRRWLTDAGFSVVEEADEWLDGYGYHHLLARVPGDR